MDHSFWFNEKIDDGVVVKGVTWKDQGGLHDQTVDIFVCEGTTGETQILPGVAIKKLIVVF